MSVKKHPIDNYKGFLLGRSTANTSFLEFIENTLVAEDEEPNYRFHKIMVHSWNHDEEILFDTISEYFSATLIPIKITKPLPSITTFYTSNLSLILRLMRLDFMFLFQANMYNIDVLFNDKTSVEMFNNHVTIDDLVSSIVCRRFNERQMLDLSNFCNDEELQYHKIFFYKLSLLATFKVLMLRIGRQTKSLNLSNNQLKLPPQDVMNFFIKGDLTEINLSYNEIHSISDLVRVSSKIEKLWVEGNPLCDDNDPATYLKFITIKFPRLIELDGIKLNEYGLGFPFNRNFLSDPSRASQMVVEKFLTLYFSHYDTAPRQKNIEGFYNDYSTLSFTTGFTDAEAVTVPQYAYLGRNSIKPGKLELGNTTRNIYKHKHILGVEFSKLPKTQHDPTTFTIDVMLYNRKCVILVVDGLFKDLEAPAGQPNVFRFRRTFVFSVFKVNANTVYQIMNEMYHISFPTPQQLAQSFQHRIRNMNTLELVDPDNDEIEAVVKIFCQIAQLKKEEAESRLKAKNWDLKEAIQEFLRDMTKDKIAHDQFMEDDDFSDSSSLIDDEMVD